MGGFDAVIVGGGAIGLAAAWRAAAEGLAVAVVDPEPGHGATWAAAGMVAPVTEAHYGEETLVELLVAGAAAWPDFARDLAEAAGHDVGYRRCGTVVVAADPSDRRAIDQLLALQQSLGLEARRMSARQCRELVPGLSPSVAGGAEVAGDHQVDNRRLVGALLAACRSAGVSLVGERVDAVVRAANGSVGGVRLASGAEVAARVTVVATGCESAQLGGVPAGVLPPVRPVKGHIVRLQGQAGAPVVSRTVRGLVSGRSCYLVPRDDGSVVVGATVEEKGFDRRVQAGAVVALLEDARRLVPGLDELELVECLAGLRPGTPDNAPYVGWTELAGLAVATGHYRNGILLTPITAEAVAALVAGRPGPGALAGFGVDRAGGRPLGVAASGVHGP